ncbi:MAG TPA: hypothetical protein VG755_39280 [Nannocystaceae bacterium]|nr:hypothetical protein [Nannocystaceae bacterium]
MTARGVGRVLGLLLVAGGCGDDGGEGGASGSEGSSTGQAATATTSSTTTTATGTSTTSGSSESSSDDGSADSSSGDAMLQKCGIDDLAPGASNPLVASDREPMQLPLEIADIMTRSCGCHLADDLVIPGDYPSGGTLDLTTWTAWHSMFGDNPTYEVARARLTPDAPILIMPPHTCDVGGGETMLPEDRARMLQWIAATAPDGVTWSQR